MVTAACSTGGQAVPRPTPPITPLNYLPALAGDYFEQPSAATGRRYHIYVRLPEHYSDDPATVRYPVVFVLDGDSLFPILAAEHLFLTIDDKAPEVITVGIAYGSFDPSINKRDRDFVAPADGVDPETAGAPAFQQFLEDELIPTVESKYRADPMRRVLFGQSLGGSFVLYSAFTNPDLFWGRIAVNPSFKHSGERYFSDGPQPRRSDLTLVVTSGTHDRPALREGALRWFKRWDGATAAPWAVKTINIEGGTHSADSANSYRAGIEWILGRNQSRPSP